MTMTRVHRIPMLATVAATGESVPVAVVLVLADELDALEEAAYDASEVLATLDESHHYEPAAWDDYAAEGEEVYHRLVALTDGIGL